MTSRGERRETFKAQPPVKQPGRLPPWRRAARRRSRRLGHGRRHEIPHRQGRRRSRTSCAARAGTRSGPSQPGWRATPVRAGWASAGARSAGWEVPPPRWRSLTVAAVDAALTGLAAMAGPGSAARRDATLTALLSAATADEQQFLVRLLTGELRQGALEGVMLDAVATAADVPAASVRRAFMLSGRLPETAATALDWRVGRARRGAPAGGPPRAADAGQPWLVAGRRARRPRHRRDRGVQARRRPHPGPPGRRLVRVWTRTLREVTDGVPELVDRVRPCRVTPPSSTARRSRWTTTAGHARSRTP